MILNNRYKKIILFLLMLLILSLAFNLFFYFNNQKKDKAVEFTNVTETIGDQKSKKISDILNGSEGGVYQFGGDKQYIVFYKMPVIPEQIHCNLSYYPDENIDSTFIINVVKHTDKNIESTLIYEIIANIDFEIISLNIDNVNSSFKCSYSSI